MVKTVFVIDSGEMYGVLNNARIGTQKAAYSIAVLVPIGSDVHAAQEILRGVAQAQTLVNQEGGIKNIPLIINDDNDTAIADQIAESLSQDRDILGVDSSFPNKPKSA